MKNIVIIGAGPAGVTAALELLKKAPDEVCVTVLEESGQIGGISRTVCYRGNRMDIGGHRFFSKDEEIMQWWADLMPLQGSPSMDDRILERESNLEKDGPDPDQTDRTMLIRKRISRIYYLRKFFDYPVSLKWQTLKNMGFLRTMEVGFSYLWSMAFKKEENCLENFYINRFGKKLYRMFFEDYTTKVWGRSPRQIAASWGAQRVKGLSVVAMLKNMAAKALGKKEEETETSLIEQFWYPKLGPGQLWETAAQEAAALGASFRMYHQVRQIRTEGSRICSVICRCPEGTVEIPCDVLISSMPIADLVAGLQPQENVPQEVKQIAADLPYRDFVTVGLLLPSLRIKNETAIPTLGNIVPDCWIYVQETQVRLGRIQIFNNWSPYLCADPENSVWVGLEYFCQEGDELWNLSEKEMAELAERELVKIGVIEKEGMMLDYHRERVKKAYPAYFDSYEKLPVVIDYLNHFENLWCIGRNGQHRYNNMDHSMKTAMEAVRCILDNRQDRDTVWNVNTEKEYHETK